MRLDGRSQHFIHEKRRQRGLKRRKSKKEPKRIQEAVGRRLELFYPAKARPIRIRLVQNSRGNVIFDPVFRKFRVMYYKQGIQVFRSFGGKFELARSKAIAFANQMADVYRERLLNYMSKYQGDDSSKDMQPSPLESNIINYKLKLQPDCNLSGLRGVFFNDKIGCWVVGFKEAGVRKYREFSVHTLGFQEAYCEAINFARFSLYRNHQFQLKRHRVRKNRPRLH
ncbi:AP2-ERF domain [Babesia duncani]|uniref:AP2-ERF domain n=1 Tax=Babesia duncani TaxID=323732 RepID=A0AAD9UQF9_9APIC|nr:AP2-ERF domain [Babesia duncani]